MRAADFHKFQQSGENVCIEFKRGGNGAQKDTFETICAFLNRFGGDVFLGVTDDGEIVGVPHGEVEPIMRHIVNVASDPQQMDPPFYLSPDAFKAGGRDIVHVRVPPSADVHRFKGVVYDRLHEADVRVRSTEAIAQMFIRKHEIYTERRVYPGIRKSDMRLDLIRPVKEMAAAFRPDHPWRKLGDAAFFKSAKLYARDPVSGKEGFNAAGVLLFGKDDVILDVFPAYRTDAIMRKVNVNRYDDRETVRTNLIEAFDALMAFGAKHLDDKFYLEGVQRVSVRGKILREVIANSLMHREFSSSMTARLIIERDRLFADNANRAAAHGIITPENVRPVSKNPIIAAFFKEIGRADELGSGTRNLYHYTRLYSGTDPIIDEEDAFSVTVPLNDDYSPEVGEGTQGNPPVNPPDDMAGTTRDHATMSGPLSGLKSGLKSGPLSGLKSGLNETDSKLIGFIQSNPSVTIQELQEMLNLSRNGVRKALGRLKATGWLRRIGPDKGGHWEVVKK